MVTVSNRVVPPPLPSTPAGGNTPPQLLGRVRGRERKVRSLCVFLLADNLCPRAEQMAGNLAITVCRNGTRASTWKLKIPRRSLIFFSACFLILSPLPGRTFLIPELKGAGSPSRVPFHPDSSL